MDVLRITTSGSVDDGKSTLIGRLLYDTKSITQDKMEALQAASKRKGLDFTDLSLLTDGLIAEREQGITIDVAHIYFSTPNRKYIIADTPGHFEYTRNMVTGASTAQVSLILIDARKGIVEQTYRHFFIACMLRIPHLVVCINKMDLVEYDEARFNQIVEDFQQLLAGSFYEHKVVKFIPISSLYGENVVTKTDKISWYKDQPLLEYLESIVFDHHDHSHPARFPVQYVIRPKTEQHHDFRGFAGKIASGSFHVGKKEIVSLPNGQRSKIKTIEKFGQQLDAAHANESVVITLEDEIDISRGNLLVTPDNIPEGKKELNASICWMDQQKLTAGKTYLLQHGANRIKAKVAQLHHVVEVTNNHIEAKSEMGLNDIGQITLRTAQPVFADVYQTNPANGTFILVDEFSNATVAVGFIQ